MKGFFQVNHLLLFSVFLAKDAGKRSWYMQDNQRKNRERGEGERKFWENYMGRYLNGLKKSPDPWGVRL